MVRRNEVLEQNLNCRVLNIFKLFRMENIDRQQKVILNKKDQLCTISELCSVASDAQLNCCILLFVEFLIAIHICRVIF